MKKIPKLTAAVLTVAALMLTVLCAAASAEREGPFHEGLYTYYQENGETILSNFDGYGSDTLLDVEVPDTMGGCPVTVIGQGCFYNGVKINSIVLPETLRSIEGDAFSNCRLVTELKIPDGVKTVGDSAFQFCEALVSLDLGKVEKIGGNAFDYCKSLETLILPDTVTELGERCVHNLTNLKTLVVGDGVTDISSIEVPLGIESVTLGRGVTSVPDGFFSGRRNLSELKILGDLSYIGEEALADTGLESFTVPDTVEVIGDKAFTGLSFTGLPSALRRVGESVYSGRDLAGAACPANLEYVGRYAFSGCTGLENFDLSGVKEFAYYAFYGSDIGSQSLDSAITIGADAFSKCPELKELTLGESLESANGAFCDDSFDSVTILCGDGVLDTGAFQGSASERTVVGDRMTDLTGVIMGRETVLGTGINYVPYSIGRVEKLELRGSVDLTSQTLGYADSLRELKVSGDVASIDTLTFAGCDALKSVEIRTGLTEIPDRAFASAGSIEKIVIDGNVSTVGEMAFEGCGELKELVMGGQLTDVGKNAFKDCSALRTAPDLTHITGVPEGLFEGSGIEEIVLPSQMNTIGVRAFSDCANLRRVVLPENIRSFPDKVFSGCSALSDINLPDVITEIGEYAFEGCALLPGTVKLGTGITEVPQYAFSGCASLTSVQIPYGVKQIDVGAFEGCASLASVDLPVTLEYISIGAFEDCTSLNGIVLPVSLTGISSDIFAGCVGLKEISLPRDIDWLPPGIFSGCSSLESLSLPNKLISIGDRALEGCTSLEHITLPQALCTINSYAFSGCTALKEIDIPASVNYIDNFAFKDCSSLTEITLPAAISGGTHGWFAGCTSLTSINVAKGNSIYKSVDGVLYSVAGGIVAYPAGRAVAEFTVPENVTFIGEYAFDSARIDKLYINENVESVYRYAFNNSFLTVYADAYAPCADSLREMSGRKEVDCFFLNGSDPYRGVVIGVYGVDRGEFTVSVINDSGLAFPDGVLYLAQYGSDGGLRRVSRIRCGDIENMEKSLFRFGPLDEETAEFGIFLWDETMWPLVKPVYDFNL